MFVGRRRGGARTGGTGLFALQFLAIACVQNCRPQCDGHADERRGPHGRMAAGAGLLAERIFETLCPLVLGWPTPLLNKKVVAGRKLREALAASQAIVSQARSCERQPGERCGAAFCCRPCPGNSPRWRWAGVGFGPCCDAAGPRLCCRFQLAGFAKADDLAYFLTEICGAQYVHQPLLAPTDDILKA